MLFTACEKELSQEGSIVPPVIEPKPEPELWDTVPTFQLKSFYSDIPIDFDDTDDEVRMETNLWRYVFEHVKDDYHVFRNDTTVEVMQNSVKMAGLDDPILFKKYSIGADNNGQFMYYLTADYKQMKYRLYEMTDDYFIIGIKWKDQARVYSRFERVK